LIDLQNSFTAAKSTAGQLHRTIDHPA